MRGTWGCGYKGNVTLTFCWDLSAADWIAHGDLGETLIVNGTYFQDWLLYDTDYNWRVERAHNLIRIISNCGNRRRSQHWNPNSFLSNGCWISGALDGPIHAGRFFQLIAS